MSNSPEARFRENPCRSISVDGRIDAELLRRRCPSIIGLRNDSDEPVTVYIDSVGGSVFYANALLSLLRSPDQDRRKRQIVTVALNQAASAAADILCHGDYSIAYPHAVIHHHGTRVGADESTVITTELADLIHEDLSKQNEAYATRLAKKIIHRQAFLISAHKGHLATSKQNFKKSAKADVSDLIIDFVEEVAKNLSIRNKGILHDAVDEISGLAGIIDYLYGRKSNRKRIDGKSEKYDSDVTIFKLILDYYKKDKKHLLDEGLSHQLLRTIEADFELHQNWLGKYGKQARTLIREVGPHLLRGELLPDYESITDERKRSDFLKENVSQDVFRLWQFSLTVAKRLQREENQLSAEDAYWLGLVDEVMGTSLPNKRTLFEQYAQS